MGSVVSMILTSCPSIRVWSPQSGSRIISPNILHHATTGRKQRSCSYTHAHVCLPERSFVESLLRESLTQEVELTCSSKNTFYSRFIHDNAHAHKPPPSTQNYKAQYSRSLASATVYPTMCTISCSALGGFIDFRVVFGLAIVVIKLLEQAGVTDNSLLISCKGHYNTIRNKTAQARCYT